MDINELTIGQAKELANMMGGKNGAAESRFKIGQAYLIRTVTMINTGRVVAINEQEIELEDAAWIAETCRYYNTLKDGQLNEVEPYPSGVVIIGRGAIVDATEWSHPLPRVQK